MTTLLRGQPVAQSIRRQITQDVHRFKKQGLEPKVVTILVGDDPASLYYVQAKQRIARKLGISFELMAFPDTVSESELVSAIERLNRNPEIHGIMLELPLPPHIHTDSAIETILPVKDVDGLTQWNRHANMAGGRGIYPATPMACVRLVKHYGYELSGRHVVLVGCGKTVGMPLFHLLLRENATVTVCHVGTQDLKSHLLQSEIAFVAVGKAGLITRDMVHSELILVDAGINETPEGKMVGDVEEGLEPYVGALSPTPGGVGTVTTMQLFSNLLHAVELQYGDESNPSRVTLYGQPL